MRKIDLNGLCNLLDEVVSACLGIREALAEHNNTTTNLQYQKAIEADFKTLDGLMSIANAVKNDIQKEIICESMKLLLRNAITDFKTKSANNPEKKILQVQIVEKLQQVHLKISRLSKKNYSIRKE